MPGLDSVEAQDLDMKVLNGPVDSNSFDTYIYIYTKIPKNSDKSSIFFHTIFLTYNTIQDLKASYMQILMPRPRSTAGKIQPPTHSSKVLCRIYLFVHGKCKQHLQIFGIFLLARKNENNYMTQNITN